MRWNKILFACLTAVLLLSITPTAFAEQAPYNNYNYNYWGDPTHSPAAYLPSQVITGKDMGAGDLKSPSDMFVSKDHQIYILDSGNNRIVVLDSNFHMIRTISSYDYKGKSIKFNKPTGIFVALQHIYIADTGNNQVVVLDKDGKVVQVINKPTASVIPKDFVFTPLKVAVDKAGRIYVISKGEFNGIMEFDANGSFIGFYGTINVSVNPISYFWKKKLSTNAQKAQMQLFLPTTFSNMDVDNQGFVFATDLDPGTTTPIRRLNPGGSDVLKRNGYSNPAGDLLFDATGPDAGPSQFNDIKYVGSGMYAALDTFRGHVFTYDEQGDLLYMFGGMGSKVGNFKTPVALETDGNKFMILDQSYNTITVFKPTVFGQAINKATEDNYNGHFADATTYWKKVVKMNTNYEVAYIGIGKSLLQQQKYKQAMHYLKLGYDRRYYSIAFKRYRRDVMRKHFGAGMTVIIVLLVLILLFRWYRKFKKKRRVGKHAVDVS